MTINTSDVEGTTLTPKKAVRSHHLVDSDNNTEKYPDVMCYNIADTNSSDELLDES